MMMNNRLNKLTDSLESNLNYYSRQKGKPTKHKKHHGSPLLAGRPKAPLLLTSRVHSRPSTPRFHSESNSILWQDEQEQQDSGQLLVLNSGSSEQILIVEEEEGGKQEQVEQQLQRLNSAFQVGSYLAETPSSSDRRTHSEKESPIFILEEEEDHNLIWINHQDQLEAKELQKSRNSAEIKIQEEQEEQQVPYYQQYVEEEQVIRARLLSQIQQLQSHYEQDIESLYNGLTTSRIPISPQTTQPFFHLHKVQIVSHPPVEESSWITQDHPQFATSHRRNNHEKQLQGRERSPLLDSSRSGRKHSKFVDRAAITKALQANKSIPFEKSLKQTEQLKADIQPKKLCSIEKMEVLIKNQSQFARQKLCEQKGTVDILGRLLFLKARAPRQISPTQTYTLNKQQQIEMNKLLLRALAMRLNL